ncbi:MAG: type 4a pilus biogenesis protein PilO [Solirubrobacterales bacterium]
MQEALANLNSSWQGLSQREKIMVAAVSVLLIGYLLYSFYFMPQQLALDAVKQRLTQTQNLALDAQNRGLGDIPKLKEQIKAFEQQNQEMQALVPASKDTPDLLVQLYELSLRDKVVLNGEDAQGATMELGEVNQHETYADYDVHMVLSDKGASIYRFVYDVARLDRMVSLNKVAITPAEGNRLKCDLTLRVFILGQAQPDPDPGSYPFAPERLVTETPYDMFKPVTGPPSTSAPSPNTGSSAGSAGGSVPSAPAQTGWDFSPPGVSKSPDISAAVPFLKPPAAPAP